jgi:hypothetical protein
MQELKRKEIICIKNIIKAWEVLKGGKRYSNKKIEDWLIDNMKPAIDEARKVLNQMEAIDDIERED